MSDNKTRFKIETVKWDWATAVQSKNIYRDDEFVKTSTREEAIASIDFLMEKAKGLTYTITVMRDNEYFTYYRHSMPCLGGLVKYRDSHGERYSMNPYFPRDIRVAFPEGTITFIACHRDNRNKLDGAYNRFILSQESPWVSSFGNSDTIIFRNNYFILTNMDTDPTVFYSLMRLSSFGDYYPSPYSAKKWNPKAEILALKTTQADPRRLAGQKPIRISGGTWSEGYGYTRPYNESIFKTTIPHSIAQFSKLSGYPQAPYTNSYFVNEMKSVFGVDFSKGITAEERFETPLIAAWDYFKEKADTLSDMPGDHESNMRVKFIRDTVSKHVRSFAESIMQVSH